MKKGSKRTWWKEISESIPAYLLIAPTIISLIVFLYVPFINTFRISFYSYKGYGKLNNFVGLKNFKAILSDKSFYQAFWHTFEIIGFDLVFSLSIGFLLAYILFRGVKGRRLFNTALFIPYLISNVVAGCIWRIIYDPNIGPINQMLGILGLTDLRHAWLGETRTALGAVIVTWIWKTIPFNMLILYANIMTLPSDYLESAMLDGATSMQQIKYIILPYLKGTFAQLALLTITNGLRSFDLVWNMTSGGPAGSTNVVTAYIYSKAFDSQRFGMASAASIAMMVCMLSLNIIFGIIKKGGEK